MIKNQAKILAAGVYKAIQGKQAKDTDSVIANFSSYLKQHHLVTMIPKILIELEKFYFDDNNMIATKISSRDKLADTEINKISEIIKNKTNKNVVVKTEEDKNLLGGTVVKYEDKIIDMSLRHQINNLAKQLSN